MSDVVSGFTVLAKLGDGARSQVYRVMRPETGEVFALKRVIRDSSEDSRFLDQAVNEWEVSTRVVHPSLRRIFELKRIKRLLKLTEVQVLMEYVDGVSLDKARPTQFARTLDVFIKVAQGLQAMHQGGYLHADIKPNNILLAYDGTVRIIDFGQCCPIGFRKPRIQGTPDYIAPEQVERQPLSPQTDVYNFGATLYWALTGRAYPTVLSKSGTKLELGGPASAPSPQQINSEVSTAVSNLAMECCEFDRRNRPRDMKDVVRRLEMAQFALSSSIASQNKTNPPGGGASAPG